MLARIFLVSAFLAMSCVTKTVAAPNGRIVNGYDADVGQFPFQIALQEADTGAHHCGGSIINEKFILTAAHCVVDGNEVYDPSYFKVRVGSIQRLAGGLLLPLKRIIAHEGYFISGLLKDIALLELEEPLVYTDLIQPIELATEEVPSGADVIISGWGLLYTGGPNPYRLQWHTLNALTTEECTALVGMGDNSLLCLAHGVGYGACTGDSGGPAVYDGKLVGVTSFGSSPCAISFPDFYTKVSYYIDWIEENIA